MAVGPFEVAVTEIPGTSLTEREWHDVQEARRSYPAMWGGAVYDIFADDPLDGRDCPLYDARHYLSWVRDGGGPWKLVTMRKVALVPSRLTERQRANPIELLPPDIRFWRVRTEDGRCVPLWDVIGAHARRLRPHDELAALRIASIGRIATHPFGERKLTARAREKTAIAFAAMQLLATSGDPRCLYVSSLCSELRDRVLGVVDIDGAYVAPGFTSTEDVLGLAPGSVCMDNTLLAVQEHKAAFPGYFIDNDDAAGLLSRLLDDGRLTLADLRATFRHLLQQESAHDRDGRQLDELTTVIAAGDHRGVAWMLTRPRLFKYLIPLIAQGGPVARLTGETGDGPFSATMVRWRWAAAAWAIIEAAEEKYGSLGRDGALRPALLALPGAVASAEPSWSRPAV